MKWTKLDFGRHKGKTLPQVMFADPDWFFWAYSEKVFDKKSSAIKKESEEIYKKSRNIKIPHNSNNDKEIEYILNYPDFIFANFQIVDKSKPMHEGSSPTIRSNHIDMAFPREQKRYDKKGCKLFINSLKPIFFDNSVKVFNKKRCEDFFDNQNNFDYQQ